MFNLWMHKPLALPFSDEEQQQLDAWNAQIDRLNLQIANLYFEHSKAFALLQAGSEILYKTSDIGMGRTLTTWYIDGETDPVHLHFDMNVLFHTDRVEQVDFKTSEDGLKTTRRFTLKAAGDV